jgi:hypothetical protein
MLDPHFKLLKKPMGGYEYIAAHRKAEVLDGEDSFLWKVAGYFPHEALQTLEWFTRTHFELPPEKGVYALSTVGLRNNRYYPNLFLFLRARLTALFEIREFAVHRMAFEKLEADYKQDLDATRKQVRRLTGAKRGDRIHAQFKLAFDSIYPDLHGLLVELVAIGDTMRLQGR